MLPITVSSSPCAALLESNTVRVLLNGNQIFPAMLEAIRGAERTITIEQYIWSPGKVSAQFVEALAGCSVTSEQRIQKPIQTAHTVTAPEFSKSMSHLLGPPHQQADKSKRRQTD